MIFFHLKNCLFPCISRQRPVRFPRRIFFLRTFRFRPKTSIFPCLFKQKSAFFTVFTACFCAFIQSSSPVRTEFPLYSVQNSRKSARHFLSMQCPKALYFFTPEGVRTRQISEHSELCYKSPPSFASQMPPPLIVRGTTRAGLGTAVFCLLSA